MSNYDEDNPGLYWAAMEACHSVGIPWTDPRTGKVHSPPRQMKKHRTSKRRGSMKLTSGRKLRRKKHGRDES